MLFNHRIWICKSVETKSNSIQLTLVCSIYFFLAAWLNKVMHWRLYEMTPSDCTLLIQLFQCLFSSGRHTRNGIKKGDGLIDWLTMIVDERHTKERPLVQHKSCKPPKKQWGDNAQNGVGHKYKSTHTHTQKLTIRPSNISSPPPKWK